MDQVFKHSSLPQERVVDGKVFPLTLTPTATSNDKASLFEWLSSHPTQLDELLRQHRGILFRGFDGMNDAQAFHDFVESTRYEPMAYIGGAAVRTQLTSRVFTANESPSTEKIPFHHEMAQTPNPPTHLMFFCEIPPKIGGETPILVSTEICEKTFEAYQEEMDRIEQLGVRYIRVLPQEDDPTSAIGRGWKSTYQCQTREEAEAKLPALASSWEWLPNGDLKTVTVTVPAVRYDSGPNRSNRKTFFNSIIAAYTGWNDTRNDGTKAVITSDGSYLNADMMEGTDKLMTEICVAFPWQKGDILLLDNRTTMHSRRPFEGERRILAALARDEKR